MPDLVELLHAKQMKRIDLARILGVDKATVTRWVQRGVPPERLVEISNATGIPASELRPDLADAFRPASGEAA